MLLVDYYFYIIKVCYKNKCVFKFGESKTDRPKKLLKEYENKKNVTAKLLYTDTLPNNGYNRLSDKVIHKYISKMYEKANKYEIQVELGTTDGITEFFICKIGESDNQLVENLKNIVCTIDNNHYKIAVEYLDNIEKIHFPQNHQVCFYYTDAMEKLGNFQLCDEKDNLIVLIGQFTPQYINRFAFRNKIIIWQDSGETEFAYEDSRCNQNITYISDLETLIKMNQDNKFNYVLSNPPYEFASQITKAIIDNVNFDTFVNLMPLSDYNKDSLYRYVSKFELVDPTKFKDAKITKNLNIAVIEPDIVDKYFDRESFEIESFDPKFKLFYEITYAKDPDFEYIYAPKNPEFLNPTLDFMLPIRSAINKPFKKGNIFKFNVLKILDLETIPWDKANKRCDCSFYRFKTEEARDNFYKFWITSELLYKTLVGLNKVNGQRHLAIPRIDWSRTDVEYTDEYVLEQMGLKWNENKDGVEKL